MREDGVGQTLVGTCGYSYDEWRGVLYPPELPKAEFLPFYAGTFPFVELDFSWYGMPKASTLARMVGLTPGAFQFAIKAHRSMSHDRGPDWRERAREFATAIEPLATAGRLATILIQLPQSFRRGEEERRYLASLCDELAAFPLAVEFRNGEWHRESVFAELDRRGAALVQVDRPDLPGLPPESPVVTGGRGYIRFHGRNKDAWWAGGAGGRYDYLYSEEELGSRLPLIREVQRKTEVLIVAFNNHPGGSAVVNARSMALLLES
ncbi:MAG TPA: DUF72 domain-containing protein [Rectinemataceae bacterium]|nr:DUF72 domain-containing protein [Rectinemataceae bacterium]